MGVGAGIDTGVGARIGVGIGVGVGAGAGVVGEGVEDSGVTGARGCHVLLHSQALLAVGADVR
jgi:hypothetical protein